MEGSKNETGYEMVSHPGHYNAYSLETIEFLERMYGTAATILWCEMTAMKYRLRMGKKPGENIQRELAKEAWYLAKKDELSKKIADTEHREDVEANQPESTVTTTEDTTTVEYITH